MCIRDRHKIEENLQNIVYINKDILGIAVTGIYGDVCFYDSMTDVYKRQDTGCPLGYVGNPQGSEREDKRERGLFLLPAQFY